uniref:Uncharacterized protein n=1 Tax=viral metagenome TaxID=1070528 RepID=A0A6M3LR41_9ZZZZ
MKRAILILAMVLLPLTAWAEQYLVIHYARRVINLNPYRVRVTEFFDTTNEALDYMNRWNLLDASLYKVEEMKLKRHEKVIDRQVIEHKEYQWTLEGQEPTWPEPLTVGPGVTTYLTKRGLIMWPKYSGEFASEKKGITPPATAP